VETGYILNILSVVAVGLLVAISGGILYLTSLEWRDRRLQEQAKRENKSKKK